MTSSLAQTDCIDALVPIKTDSTLYALRRQRDKVVAASQGSVQAVFDPALEGLSLAERLTAAQTVAALSECPSLARHYERALAACEAPASGQRLDTLLAFCKTLALRPIEGDQAALQKLSDAGLSTPDVVTLTQLIGLVSYQARVIAGLQAMANHQTKPSSSPVAEDKTPFVHPAHLPSPDGVVRIQGFTSESLGWKAWMPVLDLAHATEHQMAVLKASHPTATSSDYYLTLVQQPRILEERSAVFNAIMYAPGGMSRAERELASTVVSRINGCVYCAAVHAQRFEQLTKRNDVIVQVFTDPHTAGTTPRERAIVQASILLTQHPAQFDAAQLQALEAQGLTGLECLDLVHAIAIFAWANRLMLNLGEPVFPGK